MPVGDYGNGIGSCLRSNENKVYKKPTSAVQKTVNEFVSEAQNKQRNVEEMSSADKQQKPSSQGYDGTGGRRRRSQRLENRRKGIIRC